MGDGFSSPDPAPVDDDEDDEQADALDAPSIEDLNGDLPVAMSGTASCTDCIHFQVCSLYAGIAPMLADYGGEEQESPIDAEDLANICSAYEHAENAEAPLANQQ